MNMKGLTLLELMISLTLGILILSFIYTIFLAAEKSQEAQFALATLQENSRIATEIMSEDIRMAGNVGSLRLIGETILKYNEIELSEKNKISNYSSAEIKSGSHAITVRHVEAPSAILMKPMRGNSTLYSSLTPHFFENEILVISNFKSAEIFKVKNISRKSGMQKIVTTHPLSHLYESNAEVSRLAINTYFVAKTERFCLDGSAIYALYTKHLNQHIKEIIEGVEDMQIKFDIIQNGIIQEYPIEALKDAYNIVGIAIEITHASVCHSKMANQSQHFYVALR